MKTDLIGYEKELSALENVTVENFYFEEISLALNPDLETLPKSLQKDISAEIKTHKAELLTIINSKVLAYKAALEVKKGNDEKEILKIEKENKDLIDKFRKNKTVELLIKKSTDYSETIGKINKLILASDSLDKSSLAIESQIGGAIESRASEIESFKKFMSDNCGDEVENISFGVSCRNDRVLEMLSGKLNFNSKSPFLDLETKTIEIDVVREKPALVLNNLYNDTQKIIAGNTKKEVATLLLTATEQIFFTAIMEGDQIGGLKKTTMTPGKRALFALRLILAESDDTWPLLIDQPEDDLDSRSIYNEVVPFLRGKKKERQIIMVSHNANFVIGADSEQVIIANRHGNDRPNMNGKEFNYLTGSLENSYPKNNSNDTLDSQGVGEHSCDILDGGKIAFEKRRNKYNL